MKATFGEINQEQVSETKLRLSDKFYSGLSSEIKDHLVHCESPVSLAAAMDQAIRIDNRIFERRQEQQYNPRPFRRNQPPTQLFLEPTLSNTNSNMLITSIVSQYSNLLPQPLQLPSTQRPTLMTWTSIFSSWSSHFFRKQQRLSQGLCPCLRSVRTPQSHLSSGPTLALGLSDKVQAIEMEGHSIEVSGNDLGRL
ncbi:hypothetical protein BASA81_015696 [Batrachochytrium salamandrivorans]|nr:hypothetical protein BASA81_015696 [Batrachochytrium salamandrivorans]